MPTRPARDGETCSCGRPAIEVILFPDDGLGPVTSTSPERVDAVRARLHELKEK
jgi:hypothetical protein